MAETPSRMNRIHLRVRCLCAVLLFEIVMEYLHNSARWWEEPGGGR